MVLALEGLSTITSLRPWPLDSGSVAALFAGGFFVAVVFTGVFFMGDFFARAKAYSTNGIMGPGMGPLSSPLIEAEVLQKVPGRAAGPRCALSQ